MNTKLIIAGSVVALVLVGGVMAWKLSQDDPAQSSSQSQLTNPETSHIVADTSTSKVQELRWQQIEGGWRATGSAPDCPTQPMMRMPADLSKVTSILYPGQTRGGNYKPHGGFRFDESANADIAVEAPTDGFLVRGGQYLAEGEIQYTFDVMHPCGVLYRVGHLRVLPDNLQAIADTWPAAAEGDSRTHQINPPVFVTAGETLATSVGITQDKNVFFDWGVYDYRAENEASKAASYQTAHAQDKELSWHAVCWFDWLQLEDETVVRGLPAGDPVSGKNSDYCK